jgi:hypothetical protein
MSDFHPDSPLRQPNPIQRAKPVLELGPVAPWVGRVTVTPLDLAGYPDMNWDVHASWTGPPLPGTPTPRPGQIVAATDSYVTQGLVEARAIALRALEQLRAGAVPDLRAIARELLR